MEPPPFMEPPPLLPLFFFVVFLAPPLMVTPPAGLICTGGPRSIMSAGTGGVFSSAVKSTLPSDHWRRPDTPLLGSRPLPLPKT